MSLPLISVIVPTVAGREDHLERCVRTYTDHAAGSYVLELIIERDHPSCGLGWQAGAEKCHGDFIHLTDDDIEPHQGWAAPAIEAVMNGCVPAPQVYDPAGVPQSCPVWGSVSPDWTPAPMSSLPFCSRQQWEKITPLLVCHYFTDNFFTDRAVQAGYPCRLRPAYAFTHHWAQVKRGAGMPEHMRMQNDERLYREALRRVAEGTWDSPWPPGGGVP